MTGRLEIISEEDCLGLLSQATIGRVALSVGAMPEIFPVNFSLIDDAIVFRAGDRTKLHLASRRAVLAFEVDDFDLAASEGWSVLVVGRSAEVTHAEAIAHAKKQLSDGWVTAQREQVLSISLDKISGRRIFS